MPRYYFDTDDDTGFLWDDDGQELDGLEEARKVAQSALADMARDVVPADGPERALSVCVRDESGEVVIDASLVLKIHIKP